MANQIPATIGVMGTVATVDLNYGEKMVAFKRSVLEKMLGIQSATPKALRCFEFVLYVSYLSDDGTRGTQYNQKVLKEEDHQKHMKRVLKNGFYTAIRLVVNPLGDMAHVHKDMSEAMRNVRNLSTVNDHDIDWTIGIFNFYNTKFEETLTDLLDERKKRSVAKSSADTAQGEQSVVEEDGEEEAEESEDAEEAGEEDKTDDEAVSPELKAGDIHHINLETKGERTRKLDIKIPLKTGGASLVCTFGLETSGEDLYTAISNACGIPSGGYKLTWASGSQVMSFDRVWAYFDSDITRLAMEMKTLGGGKRAKNAGYGDDNKEKMSLKDLEREIAGVKRLLTNPSSEAVQNIIDRCEFIVARAKANPKCVCDDLIGHLDIATLTTLASGTMNAGTKISDRVSFVIENSMVAEMDKLHEMERQKEVSKKLLEHSVRFAIMTQFADGNNIQWASLVKFMTEKIGSHRPANAGDDRRGCIIG